MATNKDFIVKNGLSVGEDISVSGSVTSNLQFDDSVQAQFGTDSDLLIYHDATDNYIDAPVAGHLYIQNQVAGKDIKLRADNGSGSLEDYIVIDSSTRKVKIKYGGNSVIETKSSGIDVTGNAVLTGELHGPASFVIDPAAVGNNTGEVVIKGDLTVEGTTTTVNSTTLDVADKNITLNHGSGDTSATANDAGITIQDAVSSGNDATLLWNATDDTFDFSHAIIAPDNTRIGSSGQESVFTFSTGNNSAIIRSGSGNMEIRGTSTDYYQIFAQSGGNVGIGKIPATGIKLDVAGDITSNGTITGSDFSGITMGGSLSGSHDDVKVQYGTTFSGTPTQGHFFFDSLNQKLKVHTGSGFVDAVPAGGGGGGGSGSSNATATFRKYTYTLASSTNAVSGKEDDEVTTTNFISGRKYEITAVGNTDFTAIGASSNTIGVQFVATDVGGGSTGKAKEVLFYATGGTQNIEVYVNGVKAVEGSSNDYVATTGTSVTFTSNLAIGDVVDVQVYELLTNDSYYLKSETYTQTQIIAGFVAKSGDTMTGNLVVEKSANPTFTVTETGAGAVTIQGTGSGGRVYSNSGNKLLLGANGQNSHLTIDTSGNVTTKGNTTFANYGIELRAGNGGLRSIRSNAEPILLNRTGSDGKIIGIYSAGNEIGYIGSNTTAGNSILDISSEADDDSNIRFLTYGDSSHNEVMRLTNAGYVGIGTNSPDYLVHAENSTATDPSYIATSANGQFVMAMGSQNSPNVAQEAFIGTLSDTRFKIKVNDVTKGSWTDGGLAIGTQSSAYTDLDVAGEIAMSIGNAHAVFSSDSSGKIFIKANENKVNATTAIHMQMPIISGSGSLEDKLVINHSDISAYKHVLPNANATLDLGSSTLAWRNVYTNDLHLSNEGQEEGNSVDGTKGNWTIQEGEEHLYIINNKSGKKYKFALEEIE